MSLNRSEVRKTAFLLTYATLISGGQHSDINRKLFWQIAQEKKRDNFRQTYAKILLHVGRNSAESEEALATRAETLQTSLQGDMTTVTLREEAELVSRRSNELEAALHALNYSLTDKRRDTTDQLALCIKDTLTLAQVVQEMGAALLPKFADYPALRYVTDPYAAAVRRRCRFAATLTALSHPEELADSKEYASIARQATDLEEMPLAVEALADGVLKHRDELESELTSLLNNYSTDRLDVVDKSILLIALYELRYNKLEVPVVIAEANALADTYSGSKSAPFIHGILAAAAKIS